MCARTLSCLHQTLSQLLVAKERLVFRGSPLSVKWKHGREWILLEHESSVPEPHQYTVKQ